ncbi:MAG: DUF488 domain-containing protein [Desulfobacterales bacterium]|nr:DUF488 domain-containing protein [Desulfobacterales bacterium]MBF0397795.1 DUF488 domain-containing protein [Desulfobacterales bacterium]
MKLYTIGYGGRSKEELIYLLNEHEIKRIVDVRLRPDKSSMGIWVKAKTSDKGIEKLFHDYNISYISLPELGNIFYEYEDWDKRYKLLLEKSGDLLFERLKNIKEPYCLMCAEKQASGCHRKIIAEHLSQITSYQIEHIENKSLKKER